MSSLRQFKIRRAAILAAGAVAFITACQSSPTPEPASRAASLPSLEPSQKDRSEPVIGSPTDADLTHNETAMADVRRLQEEAQHMLDDLARLRAESPPDKGPDSTAATSTVQRGPAPPEIRWNNPGEPPASAVPVRSPIAGAAVNQSQQIADDQHSTVAAAQQPLGKDEPAKLVLRSETLDQPLVTAGPAHVDRAATLIVDLCAELHRKAAYSDRPMRELLVIAATTMLDPERAVDPKLIPGLTDRDREVLALMQGFFATLGRELETEGGLQPETEGDPERIAAAVAALSEAISKQPTIRLSNAATCWRVEGFGRYEPFNRNAFLAHSRQQMIVYVEVGEFMSIQNPAGEWVTRLSQKLIIYSDRDGIPVWQEDWQPAVDRSKNRRTDFFLTQIMTLPEALSVGKYQLKVRVRDDESRAEAETTIPFEMVADPKLAATMQ